MHTFESWLKSTHPDIPSASAQAVLRLKDEGGTIPFIARYRKEQTGNLDELAIQAVIDQKESWDNILKKQAHMIEQINEQGKLTPELKEKISTTFDVATLEDIYLPYKQKRKSKATKAREAGLQPLADWIWDCGHGTTRPEPGQTLQLWAFTFRNDEHGIKDADSAIAGAQDIIIERLSEIQELRQQVRSAMFDHGFLKTTKGEKAGAHSKFEKYFGSQEKIQTLLKSENSHRYLAMMRGWLESELRLTVGAGEGDAAFDDNLLKAFEAEACTVPDSPGVEVLRKSARLALRAHVMSSIENEVHAALKAVAEEAAIKVFAENVRQLLLAAPYGPKAVLGVDPGLRTGCKLALVDDSGKYLANTVIHLQNDKGKEGAKKTLAEVLKNAPVRAVAVGNGTAGRETESFIRTALKDLENKVPVVMVNEAGASVYSASAAAREEFPDLDVTVRGAISIARRLQDPLAELVKIDPKSIGVGQYQHDVSQNALKKSLDLVVESCVNQVGVNLNTASYHLLAHVSGIGESLAKSIVAHRNEKGLFRSREELLAISRFSKKAYEQAAGFLRIPEGDNPLDNTGVHPERYGVLEGLAQKIGKSVKDFLGSGVALVKGATDLKVEIGAFTFDDIVKELAKPGRDPREEFVAFSYHEDIHELKDLKPNVPYPGIVTNVTNFGAFVDIGVHQDGLVHISQIADKYVKDPREVVNPGDRVTVRVLEVNLEKNQIALTMKSERPARAPEPRREQRRQEQRHDSRPKQPPKPLGPPPSVKPPRKKEIFNNAFSGLADLLKPKK